ncbi:MAG: PaaI family thioesterase [Candidatus Dormibacteraeota bacterium]|nr:PaaI family thioesterase [Candidatus Dormibacteraeota bacterium]
MGDDLLQMLNDTRGPINQLIGLEITAAAPERVVGRLKIDPLRHHQPFGIVHGGVYCTMVESLASIGAALNVMGEGKTAAGVENQTSFLRSLSEGTVEGVATPLQMGRQMHLWQVEIRDQQQRLVAHGRVRLFVRELPNG